MNRLATLTVTLSVLLLLGSAQPASPGGAWWVNIEGAIGPASADYLVRAIDAAQEAGAELVVVQIDTPGGLDGSMRAMIRSVLASRIPIVGFVAPSGARAASAGTYLLYATHVAAMAPGTNLGAATPVQLGGPGLPGLTDDEDKKGDSAARKPASAMERKVVNDAVAYIQSLAQLRGRNGEWAELAVREGASLAAEDALQAGVIDMLAASPAQLLEKLDGLEVVLPDRSVTLDTSDLAIYQHPLDWRSEFLGVITNPNVALILMLLGVYGLIFEFMNPGMALPGIVGAVCLLLALYALQLLPVSYAGLGLILLGIALMVAEAFAPSFGVLGLGGVIAFIIGSVMLMDSTIPAFQIGLPVILALACFSVVLLVLAVRMVARAREQPLVSGSGLLLGATAVVESVSESNAFVRLEGERWQVLGDAPLAVNDTVRVTGLNGLKLQVTKIVGEQG